MDSSNKVEYSLRGLTTRSVTLFPTRAQVYREIKDVPLKPGDNKITVLGLSPTVDEESVKVEGSGLAVITDISVTKEDNPEAFEEIYPEFDDSAQNEKPPVLEEIEDQNDEETHSPEWREARARVNSLYGDSNAVQETIDNAAARLQFLNAFSKSLTGKGEDVNISEHMSTYKAEREKIFETKRQAELEKRRIQLLIDEAEHSAEKLRAKHVYEAAKERWETREERAVWVKEQERERRREQQEKQKKDRRKKELLEFWPKYVYNVCITLEVNQYTPMTSRRNSTSSDLEPAKASPEDIPEGEASTVHCDLLLSYVTTSAFWVPSYDMQLSTTSATGTLLFDAQLHNATAETWSSCRVTLSTAQATAASVDEPIPALIPWHIRLLGKGDTAAGSYNDISHSLEERRQKKQMLEQSNPGTWGKDREAMFVANSAAKHNMMDYQMQLMLLEQQNKKRLMMARKEEHQQVAQDFRDTRQDLQKIKERLSQQPGAEQQRQQSLVPQGFTGQFQTNRVPPGMAMKAQAQQQQQQQQQQAQQQEMLPMQTALSASDKLAFTGNNDVLNDFDFDSFLRDGASIAETATEAAPALEFQDSIIEETGLTTAYDLPGPKTLAPSSTPSKHRVARLSLANIAFSYTIVPKYKPAAYLKAKIRNGSKLTLLRGTLGLTLDGSFMGKTFLPRCSAGETLTLPLGTDPAVRVRYPGPDVRRATTGLFSKEDSSVYSRAITLENTRSSAKSKPCHVFVHDQIPVSEDERLKVMVQVPKGLTVDGGAVKAGGPGGPGPEGKDWGQADVMTKETGQVTWNVRLNPGKSVRLALEYVVAMPSGVGHSAVSLK